MGSGSRLMGRAISWYPPKSGVAHDPSLTPSPLREGFSTSFGTRPFLVEWLTEEGDVRVRVATTTLAQGVNFPVSSIVLATHYLYQPNRGKQEMSPAAFRNLAGRAGRLFQDTLGIIAFATQEKDDAVIEPFVSRQVQELASVLE